MRWREMRNESKSGRLVDREIVLAQEVHKNDSACVFAIERTKVFINCINLTRGKEQDG